MNKTTTTAQRVIIIGGGIGGLATAALLAKDGYNVTVLEKNEQLGGRASQLKAKGFTFDMGPSWHLMPKIFEKFFAQFGAKTSEYLQLKRLDPHYRVFFSDQTHLDITQDLEKTKALFEALEPGAGEKLTEYLALSKEKYDISISDFLYRNMDGYADFLSWDLLKKGPKLGVLEPMSRYVQKFFKSEKLQQIIQYTLVFLGGAPSNTPSLYSLMSHVDFNLGVWYPKGGMYEIVKAMVKLGKRHGVHYHTNSPVTSLVTDDTHAITEVWVENTKYTADLVISNADYAFTERLLDKPELIQYSDKYWASKTLAPSAFLLYLGIKGTIPELTHHNLYFGENWTKHFDDIFSKPAWPKNPSVYLNKTSAVDSTVAPKGHEALFVLVPVASKLPETTASRKKYADYIISYLETKLGISFKKKIIYQKIFSLTDFADRYNSYGGTALGLAHTLFQTAIWRPRNVSSKVKNLFFVGGNTVPGIGVPICMISAELVRQRLQVLAEKKGK